MSLSPRGPEENARLAEEVYQRLTAHKADNPSMGEVRNYLGLDQTASPNPFFFLACLRDCIQIDSRKSRKNT